MSGMLGDMNDLVPQCLNTYVETTTFVNEPSKLGYLMHMGTKKTKWAKYFVMVVDNQMLLFKKSQDKKCALSVCLEMTDIEAESGLFHKQMHVFRVAHGEEFTHYFAAESDDELQDWVRVCNRARFHTARDMMTAQLASSFGSAQDRVQMEDDLARLEAELEDTRSQLEVATRQAQKKMITRDKSTLMEFYATEIDKLRTYEQQTRQENEMLRAQLKKFDQNAKRMSTLVKGKDAQKDILQMQKELQKLDEQINKKKETFQSLLEETEKKINERSAESEKISLSESVNALRLENLLGAIRELVTDVEDEDPPGMDQIKDRLSALLTL